MLTFTVQYFAIFFAVICISLNNSWAFDLTDIQSLLVQSSRLIHTSISEDASLNFTETAIKNGHNCEEYDVTTEDGYILKLFHIIGDKTKPVLLTHGIADSSDSYIIRENTSLAIALSKAGYDVWAGNTRGNKYSRQHVSLDSNVKGEYWNFTFNEIAKYDLPALIDFVLVKTEQNTLSSIGHSQGTTSHFALGPMKPEYNDKINIFIALAPICYMNNVELKNIIDLLKLVPNFSNPLVEEFYSQEILNDNSTINTALKIVCTQEDIGYDICAKGIIFPIFGDDPEGIDKDFFPTLISGYPTSTSIKSLIHFIQIIKSGKFSQFDYGSKKNLKVYGSNSNPEYDLSKLTMKTALIVGKNDKLSTIPDVEHLKSKLNNVVKYHIMSRDKFNHLDFMIGQYMADELIPQILDILKQFHAEILTLR